MSKLSDEVVPEILSTHPANETRAVDLENLIPAVRFIQLNMPMFNESK
jgi:predicted Zn-dependent protease